MAPSASIPVPTTHSRVGESAIINYTYDVVESDDAGTELSRTATTAQITITGNNDGATVVV